MVEINLTNKINDSSYNDHKTQTYTFNSFEARDIYLAQRDIQPLSLQPSKEATQCILKTMKYKNKNRPVSNINVCASVRPQSSLMSRST